VPERVTFNQLEEITSMSSFRIPMKFAALAALTTLPGLCGAVALLTTSAHPAIAGAQLGSTSEEPMILAQCQQRVGPFATQDRAWQVYHAAESQGYSVSNGVTPCWDQYGTRGYCFNVFSC
jgi:hypothetical protein